MRISIVERALSLTLVALALAPSACRDDKAPPGAVTVPGTGGSSARGGSGGSRAGGTGGRNTGGAAGNGGAIPDAGGDTASDVGASDTGTGTDLVVTADAWPDVVTGEVNDAGVLDPQRPFYGVAPQPAGVIRPSGAQANLDGAAATFYNKWKTDYVVSSNLNNCGGAYIKAPSTEGAGTNGAVSQIHGAGMIAVVTFAGHDMNARTVFDGMFNFARKWRAGSSAQLMAHLVTRTGTGACATGAAPVDAQPDGDLHIAFALLMADKQWGSSGPINYLDEAKKTIAAIKMFEFNPGTKLPYVGDYAAGDPALVSKVRSADLMPGHFQAFFTATGDTFWTDAIAAAYTLIGKIQAGASAASGLLPEFIINTQTATPTPGAGAEGIYDYTAAGAPVHLAADYIANSTRPTNAKPVLDKINTWIKTKTASNPATVVDGYQLNGNVKTGTGLGESPLFETAFGAAAVVDASNQAWLDSIWARAIVDKVSADSLSETSQLLALIVMSGNFWAP